MCRRGDHEHTCQRIRRTNKYIIIIRDAPRSWFPSSLNYPTLFVPHRPSQLQRSPSPHSQYQSSVTSRGMPSTTSDRKVQSRIKATNVARAVRAGSESSDTSPERGREIEDTGSGPEDLDQPWPYEFKVAVKGYLASPLNVSTGFRSEKQYGFAFRRTERGVKGWLFLHGQRRIR